MQKQEPIGSRFGPNTTTSEVVAGLNLKGKVAIVTGGYSGLGLETTKSLAAAGVRVVVGAKRPLVARSVLAEVERVEVKELDLTNPTSIQCFADSLVSKQQSIDILINNAAVMACPETRIGNGLELQFATNHLGHYMLTNLLWPLLCPGARVVSVSSGSHRLSPFRWHDPQFNEGYQKWTAYGQSKTANILFAVHLDALGRQAGIRAFSVTPGKILTPLQRHLTHLEMVDAGWIDANGNPTDPTFKTPQQGAATQVWAAVSPQLEGMGGLYCEDCEIAPQSTTGLVGVRDHAIDPVQAERLWQLSAELTGLDRISRSAMTN